MSDHGFVPDPLVDHDASPCEICGEMFDEHPAGYALYVQETDKERERLEQALAHERRKADVLVKALEEARVEFDNIRGDWSEPRGYIREGRRIIDTALAQYHAATGEATR